MRIMLDSGAYTAWTSGKNIDLANYIKYAKANADQLGVVVSLDMIAGTPKAPATTEQLSEASKQSYANHRLMRKAGLASIPVFHRGESFQWLAKYLKDGEPYIGISPLANCPFATAIRWLDEVFQRLPSGTATHGFAITNPILVARYPWRSVDSTTWKRAALMGNILVPNWRGAVPFFSGRPNRFILSDDGNHQRSESILRLGRLEQARVRDYLANDVGVSWEKVAASKYERMRCNLYYTAKLREECEAKRHSPLVIYAAIADATEDLQVMKDLAWDSVLYSYAALQRAPAHTLSSIHTHQYPKGR